MSLTRSISYFGSILSKCNVFRSFSNCATKYTSYDPYPEYEVRSPYKEKIKWRYGYKPNYFTGGLLPRVKEGELKDKPLPLPKDEPWKREQWTSEKANFGQNDYIDILGDGDVKPWELSNAPVWLRGHKETHEITRLYERLRHEGKWLQETQPEKYHRLRKHVWYLYKRINNKRLRRNYWGHKFSRSRFVIKEKPWDED